MRVVNIRKEGCDFYIGRPSPLGNPFIIGKDGTRDDVIQKYEVYIRDNKELLRIVELLPNNAVLGCYCKPKACHGDVIIKLYKEMHDESNIYENPELLKEAE